MNAMYAVVFISIMLNIVCLYLIFNLYNKFQKQSNSQNSTTSEEVEELLELFSEEMKIENERLHEMIIKLTQKNHQQKDLVESTNTETEENRTDLQEPDEKHFSKETNEVLILAQKGYNAEEIAKMLHRGKGEVELLLKFYR
jgi:biopolymer transport protein ExbB/TolQ